MAEARPAPRFDLWGPGCFRFALAGLVVLDHFTSLALGRLAVFVFFMLSGYWIARIYCEKYAGHRFTWPVFIASRFLRLWPVYALCLALATVEGLWLGEPGRAAAMASVLVHPLSALRLAVIVSSSPFQGVFLSPAWSIDVEMQFYLLIPCLLALHLRGYHRLALGLGLLGVASCGAVFFAGPLVHDGSWVGSYGHFFLVGTVIYLARWQASRRVGLASLALLGGVVLLGVLLPGLRGYFVLGAHWEAAKAIYNEPVNAALAFLAVPYVAFNVGRKGDRLDGHLGNLSYVIYMVHWLVVVPYVEHLARIPTPLRAPFLLGALGVTYALSLAIYRLYDRPLERLRHGWLVRLGYYQRAAQP